MTFQISGLNPDLFSHLFSLSDDALEQQGIQRCKVDEESGIPDRIGLRDLDAGETALLLNYEHLPVKSPYRSRHAIFISETPQKAGHYVDEVPLSLVSRTISLRAFDEADHIIQADLASGPDIKTMIEAMLEDPSVSYIHAHFAKPGCFAAEIRRA